MCCALHCILNLFLLMFDRVAKIACYCVAFFLAQTKITRNVHAVEYHVANYQKIINELRNEVQMLRSQLQEATSLTLGPGNMTVVSFNAPSPKHGGGSSRHSLTSGSSGAKPMHATPASSTAFAVSGNGSGSAAVESPPFVPGGPLAPREQSELDAFREELQSNFQNRLQIKRNLVDLDEMSLQQTIELNRRQVRNAARLE
jgi:hypothetical protein